MTAIDHPVILRQGARDTPTTVAGAVMAIREAAVVVGDWVQIGAHQEAEAEAEALGSGPRRRTVGECLSELRRKTGKHELLFWNMHSGNNGRVTRVLLQRRQNKSGRANQSSSELYGVGAVAEAQAAESSTHLTTLAYENPTSSTWKPLAPHHYRSAYGPTPAPRPESDS